MSIERPRTLFAALTALCFLLCSSHALAGIIVTEGKISRCALTLQNSQALWNLGVWPDEQEGCTPTGDDAESDDESEDTGHDFDEEDEELDLEEDDLSDLDSAPEGYTCSDLGNGVELCEADGESDDESDESDDEEGQGAGAGSAYGGTWLGGATYGSPDGAQEHSDPGLAGCQAGGELGDSLGLLFSILLGLAVTRRRREGVTAS